MHRLTKIQLSSPVDPSVENPASKSLKSFWKRFKKSNASPKKATDRRPTEARETSVQWIQDISNPVVAVGSKKAISPTNHSVSSLPSIDKLPARLLQRITDFLDYPSAVLLKVSSKKLYKNITMPASTPTKEQKLIILRLFPAQRPLRNDKYPPYLCHDCMIWHSFVHLTRSSSPLPKTVQEQEKYVKQQGHSCIRYVYYSGKKHTTHESSVSSSFSSPQSSANHSGYSSNTSYSSRASHSTLRSLGNTNSGPSQSYLNYTSSVLLGNGIGYNSRDYDSTKKTCGRCLGYIDYERGNPDMCRCREDNQSSVASAYAYF